MIILKVEKQNMYQNSLHKLIFLCFFCSSLIIQSQELQEKPRKLKKIGFLYNRARSNNFLFKDSDYTYSAKVFKTQFYYLLNKGRKWDINLIVQPQIQVLEHQLLNLFFITPDEPNFEELRDRLTQKRTMSLTAFELGFQFRRETFKNIFFEANFGLGVAYIDKETERLARGFTFIENISLGFAHAFHSSEFYIGGQIGHVSNFDFQMPNSGYDTLGFEIGYRILLK